MSYSSEVLADSPLLYWRFNSGGTDSSGNGHTATSGVNGTSVAGLLTGDSDGATAFDGSTQYLALAWGSWMNTTTLTLETWIKTTSAAQSMIAERDTNDRAWQFRMEANGKISFIRVANSSNVISVVTVTSTGSVNDGSRHHVAAVVDATTIKIYIDGTLDTSTSYSGGLLATGQSPLTVARYHDGSLYLGATLDEFAWYGSALSASRISTHYNVGTGNNPSAASGTASLSLSASGAAGASASGTASLSLAASSSAAATTSGTASLNLTAIGDVVPPVDASGTASLALSAAGIATASPAGTASLNLQATGTAMEVLAASGTATLSLAAAGSADLSAAGTASLALSAIGTARALFETDTSNAFDGRTRGAYAIVTLTRTPAALPPAADRAQRVDKALALRDPVMAGGRPT